MINENYLKSMNRQFLFYKNLGEKAIAQMKMKNYFTNLMKTATALQPL